MIELSIVAVKLHNAVGGISFSVGVIDQQFAMLSHVLDVPELHTRVIKNDIEIICCCRNTSRTGVK